MSNKPDSKREPASANGAAETESEESSTSTPENEAEAEVVTEDNEESQAAESEEDSRELTIEERLAEAEKTAAENHDQFLRARADLENAKRRFDRGLAERTRYGAEGIARDLLQTVDDLERAIEHAREAGEADSLIEGVELVLKGVMACLANHSVTQIEAAGRPFDPNHHEAIAHVESAEVEAGTVLDEHRSGFLLHDRLLRPAMVSVAKSPQTDDDTEN